MHGQYLHSLSETYGYCPNHNLRYIALAELIEKHEVTDLLVLGCGKGILESILPDKVKCTSIDIKQDDLETARHLNRGKKNRNFICCDINAIKTGKYSAVLISEVLEHLQDDEAALRKAGEFLRKDGILFLTVPNRERLVNTIRKACGKSVQFMSDEHIREYSKNEALALLNRAGFKPESQKEVYVSFPKEHLVRKVVSIDSLLRRSLLRMFENIGTYYLFVTHKII